MEESVFDLVAVGELLVDMISTHLAPALAKAERFQRFLGGQVANVARNVSLIGGRSALVSCIGSDGFGLYLYGELEEAGVETGYLQVHPVKPTTLVVIPRQLVSSEFIVYRGADAQLALDNGLLSTAASSRSVHSSAFALSREPSRSTALQALAAGRQAGALVSLDMGYFPRWWSGPESPLEVLATACNEVDVVKASLDDCRRLWNLKIEADEGAERFLQWGARTVVITREGETYLALADGTREVVSSPVAGQVAGVNEALSAGLLMALLDGLSPHEAVRVGQALAERKERTVGPLVERIDRQEIYAQLFNRQPPLSAPGKHTERA